MVGGTPIGSPRKIFKKNQKENSNFLFRKKIKKIIIFYQNNKFFLFINSQFLRFIDDLIPLYQWYHQSRCLFNRIQRKFCVKFGSQSEKIAPQAKKIKFFTRKVTIFTKIWLFSLKIIKIFENFVNFKGFPVSP